ncbi:hypothetical protein HYW74_04005 [Candidatus Pacearchaeota archaeon]|nr:hypothetical protein [Candidatus Pacearchaeota archaeon]
MIRLFKKSIESSIESEYQSITRQLGRILGKRKTSRQLAKANSYQMELLYFVTSKAYNNTDFFTQKRIDEIIRLSKRAEIYFTKPEYQSLAKIRTEGIEEVIENAKGLKELFLRIGA